jgi:hypothetical protein
MYIPKFEEYRHKYTKVFKSQSFLPNPGAARRQAGTVDGGISDFNSLSLRVAADLFRASYTC